MMITGASRGIGAATARLAAERGYDVCVNFRRDEAAAAVVVRDAEAAGARAIAVGADVGVDADVVRLFAACDRGLGRLDALVNNAGILETQMRVESMDAARLARVFGTNITGAFLCAREARAAHVDASRRRRRRDRQRLVGRGAVGIAAANTWTTRPRRAPSTR